MAAELLSVSSSDGTFCPLFALVFPIFRLIFASPSSRLRHAAPVGSRHRALPYYDALAERPLTAGHIFRISFNDLARKNGALFYTESIIVAFGIRAPLAPLSLSLFQIARYRTLVLTLVVFFFLLDTMLLRLKRPKARKRKNNLRRLS